MLKFQKKMRILCETLQYISSDISPQKCIEVWVHWYENKRGSSIYFCDEEIEYEKGLYI